MRTMVNTGQITGQVESNKTQAIPATPPGKK